MPLFDMECTRCGRESEHFLVGEDASARLVVQQCECSKLPVAHRRLISRPAKYTGDRSMPQPHRLAKWEFEKPGNRGMPKFPNPPAGKAGDLARDHMSSKRFRDKWTDHTDKLRRKASGGKAEV